MKKFRHVDIIENDLLRFINVPRSLVSFVCIRRDRRVLKVELSRWDYLIYIDEGICVADKISAKCLKCNNIEKI